MDWPDLVSGMDDALLSAFGQPTTYTPSGGQAHTINGIFDAAYVHVDVGEMGFSSPGPAVFYRLEDLPVDPTTDDSRIVINGLTYKAAETKKDGQGGVLLRLHRV